MPPSLIADCRLELLKGRSESWQSERRVNDPPVLLNCISCNCSGGDTLVRVTLMNQDLNFLYFCKRRTSHLGSAGSRGGKSLCEYAEGTAQSLLRGHLV